MSEAIPLTPRPRPSAFRPGPFLVLAVLLAIAVRSAMGAADAVPPAASGEKVRILSQDLPNPGATGGDVVARRAVLKAFLDRYPQYEVEPFAMPALQGSSMESGPLMAIAAGVPPHAIYVNFRMSSTYIEQGFLEPIETLLARVLSADEAVRQADEDGRWQADPSAAEIERAVALIKERVPGPAWPVVYREDESGAFGGEHVWALPTGNLVVALLYRKDLFRQAGLDPDRPPQTWDELLDYARRLTIPERRQYGIWLSTGSTVSWTAYTYLASNGATVVERDASGQWRATYDTPEAAEAIEYVWQLTRGPFERDGRTIHGAALSSASSVQQIMWQRGQLAMFMTYLADDLLGTSNPQLVGVAPVPTSYRGTRGSELNCRMLGVFSGSTPAQKLAVMRYLWFITGDEAQQIRTQVFVENGLGTFVNPMLLAKFGYDDVLRQVPKGWREAYETAVESGVPEPYGRNTQNIWRDLSVPINEALELPVDRMSREEAVAAILELLERSAAEVNVKVLGIVPPAEMTKRRVVAAVVITAVALAFVVGLRHVWQYFSRTAAPTGERGAWRTYSLGYVFLVPALALIVWWQYVPLGGGLGMAFLDYRIARDSAIVGVDNFANVLFDARFWSSLGRTFYFLLLMIGLGFWPPILLAILLQEVPTNALKYLFRTVYYLPAVISGVIVMFLWRQLYDASEHGVLNQLVMSVNALGPVSATALKLLLLGVWLSLIGWLAYLPWKVDELSLRVRVAMWMAAAAFGAVTLVPLVAGGAGAVSSLVGRFHVEPLRWIESPELAMLCIVIPTVWAGAGPGCIIYLAALKTVPDELYEAADIDGASHAHKVFYIVFPQLRYLIVIQFMAAVVGAMKGGADYILAMTGGGPNGATNILALEIFTRTFLDLKFGIGTAMSWILGALLIGVTAYQLKMLSRAEFKARS